MTLTPDQRADLIDAIADALNDRNDIDVTFEKFAIAVVELFEKRPEVRVALRAILDDASARNVRATIANLIAPKAGRS